ISETIAPGNRNLPATHHGPAVHALRERVRGAGGNGHRRLVGLDHGPNFLADVDDGTERDARGIDAGRILELHGLARESHLPELHALEREIAFFVWSPVGE